MSNYKELKDTLRDEKNRLEQQLNRITPIVNRYNKINNIIEECFSKEDEFNPSKLSQLKKYFPEIEEFTMMEKLGSYSWIILHDLFKRFNTREFIVDVEKCAEMYGFPSEKNIKKVKDGITTIDEIKSIAINKPRIRDDSYDAMVHRQSIALAEMHNIVEGAYFELADKIIIKVRNKTENIDKSSLLREIDDIKERIGLIDIFNMKFSNDELLSVFESEDELILFTRLIQSLFDRDKFEEIIKNILFDGEKEEVKAISITFDNLDMSQFNDSEKFMKY